MRSNYQHGKENREFQPVAGESVTKEIQSLVMNYSLIRQDIFFSIKNIGISDYIKKNRLMLTIIIHNKF